MIRNQIGRAHRCFFRTFLRQVALAAVVVISFSLVLSRKDNLLNILAGSDHSDGNLLIQGKTLDDNLERINIVTTIINTADGYLHGLDGKRQLLWSSNTGGAMMSSSNNYPPPAAVDGGVGWTGADETNRGIVEKYEHQKMDSTYSSDGDDHYTVVPATDGSLFFHTRDGMRKTSVTARFLSERTPFVSKEGVIFTGSRRSSLIGLDLSNGKVLHDFSDGKFDRKMKFSRNCAGGIPGGCASVGELKPIDPFWLGRVDYMLRAIDGDTGIERFNISYSEVHPLSELRSHNFLSGTANKGEVSGYLNSIPASDYDVKANAVDEYEPQYADESQSMAVTVRGERRSTFHSSTARKGAYTDSSGSDDSVGDVLIVSTPDGDLYFADSLGKVLDPVPISLKSPVIKAFRLRSDSTSELVDGDQHMYRSRRPSIDIKHIKVHHRMMGVDAESKEEHQVVVVQSSLQNPASKAGHHLYAVEAVPYDFRGDHEDNAPRSATKLVAIDSARDRKDSYEVQLDSHAGRSVEAAPWKTGQRSNQQQKQRKHQTPKLSDPIVSTTAPKIGKHINSLSVLNKVTPSPIAHPHRPLLTRTHHSKHAPLPEETPLSLPSTDYQTSFDACEGWFSSVSVVTALDAAVSGEYDGEYDSNPWARYSTLHRFCDCAAFLVTPIQTDALGFESFQRQITRNILTFDSTGSPDAQDLAEARGVMRLRGQHVLKPEVYEGNLFSPQLFTGVLGPDSSDEFSGFSSFRGNERTPPSIVSQALDSKSKSPLWNRIFGTIEFATVLLVAAILGFMVIVFFVVVSIRTFRFLPGLLPERSLPDQVVFLCRLMLFRALSSVQTETGSVSFAELIELIDPHQENTISRSASAGSAGVHASKQQEEVFDEQGRRQLQIGALRVHVDEVLGYGSQGTVVYRGSLNGRPLAVKRILSQFTKSAEREISLLIRSDGHPNVVRYFMKEQRSDFLYLGLQLCEMSLKDLVVNVRCHQSPGTGEIPQSNSNNRTDAAFALKTITDSVRTGLLEISMGLAHLHSQRIVHRDIKPHNILCARKDSTNDRNEAITTVSQIACGDRGPVQQVAVTAVGSVADNCSSGSDIKESSPLPPPSLESLADFTLKISDMGLSKQLDNGEQSFSTMSFSIPMLLHEQHSQTTNANGEQFFSGSSSERSRSIQMMQAPVGTIGWQAPELISAQRSGVSSSGTTSAPVKQESISSTKTGENNDDTANCEDEDDDDTAELLDAVSEDDCTADCDESSALSAACSTAASQAASTNRLAVKKEKKRTLTVDVFSLGCVFYYVLTLGDHPFGEWFQRETNILNGNANLDALDADPAAKDLIAWMLKSDPLQRPTAKEVCGHPFFWSCAKRLEFLVELSDRFEQEPADSVLVLALESGAIDVIGQRWDRRLDSALLEDMGKYRKYDANSVRDLLRVIRNKRHHFHELSDAAKESIGSLPIGFYNYFDSRFPQLLLHCADVANRLLSGEKLFSQWINTISRDRRRENIRISLSVQGSDMHEKFASDYNTTSPRSLTSSNGYNSNLNAGVTENLHNTAAEGRAYEKCVEEPLNVVLWQGSVLESSLGRRGWWRSSSDWVEGSTSFSFASGGSFSSASNSKKLRPAHIVKSAADLKYRTRLCQHWENTGGAVCPMRKKGKCIFAHGPLELRVKDGRRGKWGKHMPSQLLDTAGNASSNSSATLRFSGGEDVLGAARAIEKMRTSDSSATPFSSPTVSGYGKSASSHSSSSGGGFAGSPSAAFAVQDPLQQQMQQQQQQWYTQQLHYMMQFQQHQLQEQQKHQQHQQQNTQFLDSTASVSISATSTVNASTAATGSTTATDTNTGGSKEDSRNKGQQHQEQRLRKT